MLCYNSRQQELPFHSWEYHVLCQSTNRKIQNRKDTNQLIKQLTRPRTQIRRSTIWEIPIRLQYLTFPLFHSTQNKRNNEHFTPMASCWDWFMTLLYFFCSAPFKTFLFNANRLGKVINTTFSYMQLLDLIAVHIQEPLMGSYQRFSEIHKQMSTVC